MSEMLMACVQVEGVRTILFHAINPETFGDGSGKRKEREGTAGNDPGEWRKTVLMTPDRQLYVKPDYVFGALIQGAKYTKRGKGTLQRPLASTLQVLDNIILLDRFVPDEPLPKDLTEPVFLSIMPVRNPTTRGANIRYRVAASPGWHCDFNLSWDSTIISRTEMEAVVGDAGKFAGLADGRSIGYGRFRILSFEVHDA